MLVFGWGAVGCGEFDRDINPPPPIAGVGEDGDADYDEEGDAEPARGGAGDGSNADDGGNDAEGDPVDDPGAEGEGTGISGKLKAKDGVSVEAPVLCEVRVYSTQQIDPSTGSAQGSALTFPMTVWAFPQYFDILPQELEGFSDSHGYVAGYCDTNGDGSVDDADGLVAHYPELPMSPVPIPGAEEVWLYLSPLD